MGVLLTTRGRDTERLLPADERLVMGVKVLELADGLLLTGLVAGGHGGGKVVVFVVVGHG